MPATIGVLDGRVQIGLGRDELERFTTDARKAGPRDLAACAVQGAVGATTVGGALTVARMVGIRFLGTGGIGGVHRGFPSPPDVSADLLALVQSPVLVACSGAKSLLDIPATMEYLETLGIPVLGFRTDTLPLFYSAAGGPPVAQRVEDSGEAARVADAHWRRYRPVYGHRHYYTPHALIGLGIAGAVLGTVAIVVADEDLHGCASNVSERAPRDRSRRRTIL